MLTLQLVSGEWDIDSAAGERVMVAELEKYCSNANEAIMQVGTDARTRAR